MDERLRALWRRAGEGDPAAAELYARALQRVEGGGSLEDAAREVICDGYRRDVAALADDLERRAKAGEFTGGEPDLPIAPDTRFTRAQAARSRRLGHSESTPRDVLWAAMNETVATSSRILPLHGVWEKMALEVSPNLEAEPTRSEHERAEWIGLTTLACSRLRGAWRGYHEDVLLGRVGPDDIDLASLPSNVSGIDLAAIAVPIMQEDVFSELERRGVVSRSDRRPRRRTARRRT